jgi:hypothetical protein
MKNNLGRYLFILLFPILLFSDSRIASYTLNANKTQVSLKEAVEVTCVADQKDHSVFIAFFLKPRLHDDYKIILLNENTFKRSEHDITTTFKFLVFPLKTGDISIDFDFSAELSNTHILTDLYTGSNATAQLSNSILKKLPIAPLHLHVSPLKEKVDLVGDFTLDAKLQNSQINQYGAANIRYMIKGVGYAEENLQVLNKITNVTTFSQINDNSNKNTPQGFDLDREYSYALSSTNSFTIPAVELKAYSPKSDKYYTLKAPSYSVSVKNIDPATLIDQKEFPQTKAVDFSWLQKFATAILIFIAGFATAKLAPNINFKRVKKERFDDIKKAKDAKEMILILMQNYSSYDVKKSIDELENLEYKKEGKSFKEIKTELLTILQTLK